MKNLSFSRSKFLAVCLSLFALVICYQMIRIQNSSEAEYLDEWAKNYGYEVRTIQSERGYIYDRWGNLLAGNKEVYEVGIELQFVKIPPPSHQPCPTCWIWITVLCLKQRIRRMFQGKLFT